MKLLASIADTSKDGLISFSEFQAFEGLLCTPDALYKTAFQLFDRKGNGTVQFGELKFILLKVILNKIENPIFQMISSKWLRKLSCILKSLLILMVHLLNVILEK